jgi:hypothetical protein
LNHTFELRMQKCSPSLCQTDTKWQFSFHLFGTRTSQWNQNRVTNDRKHVPSDGARVMAFNSRSSYFFGNHFWKVKSEKSSFFLRL